MYIYIYNTVASPPSASAGVVALAAGERQTCALLTGGSVDCWGLNGGDLGTGDTNNRYTPTGVTGLGAGVRGGAVVLL